MPFSCKSRNRSKNPHFAFSPSRIKSELSILELSDHFNIHLYKVGKNYKTHCFYNKDSNPSLVIDVEKDLFKCFSCGRGGTVIDYYMAYSNVDLKVALKELSEHFNLVSSNNYKKSSSHILSSISKPVHSKKNTINTQIYSTLFNYCRGLDKNSLSYLLSNKRNLSLSTIKRFGLFTIKDYKKTSTYLKNNFSIESLKNSGLLNDAGNLIFYRHRLIIPFFKNGKIVYLRGRYFYNNSSITSGCKYLGLNSIKSKRIFNVDTLNNLKIHEDLYLTEGEFDCMVLSQEGFASVGILGVNNIDESIIKELIDYNVILCFDNDQAGLSSSMKIGQMFYDLGRCVRIKRLPSDKKDITEYFMEY